MADVTINNEVHYHLYFPKHYTKLVLKNTIFRPTKQDRTTAPCCLYQLAPGSFVLVIPLYDLTWHPSPEVTIER